MTARPLVTPYPSPSPRCGRSESRPGGLRGPGAGAAPSGSALGLQAPGGAQVKALGGSPSVAPAAVRGPRADFTARNVLFWERNNTTASKFFRRLVQPPQLGSAVLRSHLSDSPPAAPLRLGGSVRPRKPRPRLPAPQPDPPEPPGPAEQPAGAGEAERQRANPAGDEGVGVEGGQRLRRG